MFKYAVAATLFAVASPALAAEYYLAKDPGTGKCSVVDQKPDGTKLIRVGTETYATREEGKAAKKAAKASGECKKDKDESKS
jgi:hypothetical protein